MAVRPEVMVGIDTSVTKTAIAVGGCSHILYCLILFDFIISWSLAVTISHNRTQKLDWIALSDI